MHKMSKESANTLASLQCRLKDTTNKLDDAEQVLKTVFTMCDTAYTREDIKIQINTYWGVNNEKK